MDILEKVTDLLASRRMVAFFAVVGCLAGLVRILDYAFPAVVESAATVFLALVTLYLVLLFVSWLLRLATRPELGDSRSKKSMAEGSFRHMSERYGMGHDLVEVNCSIAKQGSAKVQRTVIVQAHAELDELDTFLVIPEEPPEGVIWDIDLIEAKSLTKGRDVSVIYRPARDKKQSVVLAISPQLGPGEKFSYEMTQRLPEKLYAFDLTKDELADRQDPYDYFGWTINRPTRKLSLRVYFPEDFKPRIYGLEVRYWSAAPGIPSERRQREEQNRLERPILDSHEVGRHYLQLEAEYPMLGLVYILRWKPLPVSKPL